MNTNKEYREFFLRNTPLTIGAKKDQEMNYPTKYITLINNVLKEVGNRFLKNHVPSQDIYEKWMHSIGHLLNTEDSATETTQGFVSLATNAEVLSGTNTDINGFPLTVKPSQLGLKHYILLNDNVAVTNPGAAVNEVLKTITIPANTITTIGSIIRITISGMLGATASVKLLDDSVFGNIFAVTTLATSSTFVGVADLNFTTLTNSKRFNHFNVMDTVAVLAGIQSAGNTVVNLTQNIVIPISIHTPGGVEANAVSIDRVLVEVMNK